MSVFTKPLEQIVTDQEYISKLVDANLHKDLHDDEEICVFCHGTGLVIRDNPYGLSNDPNRTTEMFPYKHQAISFCPNCYNGIVHKCKLCGQILPRGTSKCNCEKQREIDRLERERKAAEALENAPIAPQEVAESCACFYSDCYPHNEGYFLDWESFFDAWECYHEPDDDRPEYVWITESVDMHIDAYSIVESATEDLYEDAASDIPDEKIKQLQKYLNDWCKSCGVGKTYYESHKYKVRIPWDQR